jgi:enoyl-CoA hydratase/carnithine racemase
MVNAIFPEEDLLEETVQIAQKLCAVDRTALAETKKLFHQVADLPLDRALEIGRDTNRRMRGFGKPGPGTPDGERKA